MLFAKKKPMAGMRMMPKTVAYIWMISMGLATNRGLNWDSRKITGKEA